jgi:hypothetical protein
MTAPGWYPDPSDQSRQRYFDGSTWTENYAPYGPPPQSVSQSSKSGMSKGLKIALGVGAAAVALVILASLGSSDKSNSNDNVALPSSGGESVASSAAVLPTTTESGFTPSQDNAIAKAKSYLSYTSFSQPALQHQLEFDGFTPGEAEYGANTAYGG